MLVGKNIQDNEKTDHSPGLYLYIFLGILIQILFSFYVGQLIEPEENPGFRDITTCKDMHLK